MPPARDLSRGQFVARMKAAGFVPELLGYWRLPFQERHVCVNELNGGPRLRDRLAYLLREADRRKGRVS